MGKPKFRESANKNIRANKTSLEILNTVKYGVEHGTISEVMYMPLFKNLEELDTKIENRKTHVVNALANTIEQVHNYSDSLRHKVKVEYTKHEILEHADSVTIKDIVFDVLEKIDPNLLVEYMRKVDYGECDFTDKITEIKKDKNFASTLSPESVKYNQEKYGLTQNEFLKKQEITA